MFIQTTTVCDPLSLIRLAYKSMGGVSYSIIEQLSIVYTAGKKMSLHLSATIKCTYIPGLGKGFMIPLPSMMEY